jgi:hypothetical protein
MFCSFYLFISALFTPTWTAKLISGVNLGNLAAAAGTIPEKAGKSIPAMRVGNKRGK